MRLWKRWLAACALFLVAAGALTGAAAAQDEDPVVVIDATGAVAPASAVNVAVQWGDVDTYVYVLQCRTGTDICEYRSGFPVVDGAGSGEVIIRRALLTNAGRANCSQVVCEIRVVSDSDELVGAVPIDVDAGTVIERPSITIEPHVDLVDRSVVEISGSGYEPNSFVEFRQCTIVSCARSTGYADVDSSGEFYSPAALLVQRLVGSVDCAESVCFVLGLAYGNGDSLTGELLSFDPDSPPAPAAAFEVSPTNDLVHDQLVSATGTGFVAGEYVRLSQCAVGDADIPVSCTTIEYVRADANGGFVLEVAVRRRVGGLDCAVDLCVLYAHADFDELFLPLSFDDAVPPPPLPTASAAPTAGLVDHQMIELTVQHLDEFDYVSLQQCVVGTGLCRSSSGSSATEVPWTTSATVVRDIGDADCAIVACELVIDIWGDDRTRLTILLEFDPDGPRADPPSIRVLPASGLWDGQRVEIKPDNVLPGDYVIFAQCPPGATSYRDCGETVYSFDGADRLAYSVQETLVVDVGDSIDQHDCQAVACELVMFDSYDERLDETALSFSDGAASGGVYPMQLECVAWPTDAWPTGPVPAGVDPVELQEAIDNMLASDTDAVVVIHGGKLVGEGYDRAMSVDSINRSFSVSKTFVGTVIGMLVDEGLLELDAPAPVPEWSDTDDPRHEITLRDLMNMAAGLEWNESYSFDINTDIIQMLLTPDSASYVAEKPLVNDPGTLFNYSTGTTQILARIISDTLDKYGDDLRQELDNRLFDVLGQQEEIQVDPAGVWRGGGWTDMSTRDFARLGLLHLRGGVWEDEQLVSREWIEFVHEPSPASAGYAGQIWRRGGFVEMVGLYGQKVTVRPDLDLIVASNTPPNDSGAGTYEIVELFESVAPASCSDEPVLVGDSGSTVATESVPLDVLANDPGRGSALRPDTLSIYDLPEHGSAEVVGGQVVYTPDLGFSGVEEFSYLVCTDAPYCGTASITVTVAPWGMSLRHADAVVMGSVLQLRVRATDAPTDADLDPIAASVVEIDCDSSEVVGPAEHAVYRTTHPSGLTYVRWTTDDEWDGCRRLVLTFGDGSTLGADVTMLVPIP